MNDSSVTIEPLDESEFALVGSWLSDPEINRWLYGEWRGRTVDERLVAIMASGAKNRLFVVRLEGDSVGLVALGEINTIDRSASVWYLLGDGARKSRGVTSEAVRLAVQFAFDELDMHSVYASVVADNVASARILVKNGFRLVGRYRQGFRIGGEFVDRVVYDRLRDEA